MEVEQNSLAKCPTFVWSRTWWLLEMTNGKRLSREKKTRSVMIIGQNNGNNIPVILLVRPVTLLYRWWSSAENFSRIMEYNPQSQRNKTLIRKKVYLVFYSMIFFILHKILLSINFDNKTLHSKLIIRVSVSTFTKFIAIIKKYYIKLSSLFKKRNNKKYQIIPTSNIRGKNIKPNIY